MQLKLPRESRGNVWSFHFTQRSLELQKAVVDERKYTLYAKKQKRCKTKDVFRRRARSFSLELACLVSVSVHVHRENQKGMNGGLRDWIKCDFLLKDASRSWWVPEIIEMNYTCLYKNDSRDKAEDMNKWCRQSFKEEKSANAISTAHNTQLCHITD